MLYTLNMPYNKYLKYNNKLMLKVNKTLNASNILLSILKLYL